MTNIYTCTINKLDVHLNHDSLSDVVYKVHWTYTVTSNQLDQDEMPYSASTIGVFSVSDPDPENFTNFSDLTQSQVEGWLTEGGVLSKAKYYVDSVLEKKLAPITETKDVPWEEGGE
jgi:hypothetical protein